MADRVGRFPWPRSVYGEVVLELNRQGATAVVMDVELYEPDLVRPEQDLVLNEALAGSTNTFFPIRLLERIDDEEGVRLAEFAEVLALSAPPGANPQARAPMQLPFVLDPSAWSRTGLINYVEDADAPAAAIGCIEVGGWRFPRFRRLAAAGYPAGGDCSARLVRGNARTGRSFRASRRSRPAARTSRG
jgi:adenylate cyclase